jgi:hypothetical protein
MRWLSDAAQRQSESIAPKSNENAADAARTVFRVLSGLGCSILFTLLARAIQSNRAVFRNCDGSNKVQSIDQGSDSNVHPMLKSSSTLIGVNEFA